MRKYLVIVDRNRAEKLTRFANFFIDRLVISAFFLALGFIASLLYNLANIDFLIKIVYKMSEMNRFLDILITSLIYFIYTFLIEYFTKGRSVGKYITGTKVICTDGTEPTFNDYLIRNISRIVPFDTLSFFGENGWHDKWSETRVINIKNYQAEIQSKSEIEDLGKKEIA
ncbi:putative RDD family membrane protein YckC [Chryseobacterium vietnamense]|uniref:RDD family protein n=1 Tax=Chryseobacterium vietnamense TaxID=866785 RepID=UPI00285E45A2|nr:RDD family protein [Chryseobacterium vietnamense]MDR6487775.1 putative RDD family membrane protein YckC [Chryseobacterium vietnamense]